MTPELALLLTALAGIVGTATFAIIAEVRRMERDRIEEVSMDDLTKYRGVANEVRDLFLAKEREADVANIALRECQGQMMRGAAVLHHKRPNPHQWADPELEVVRTDAGGLAFTDAEWSRARARYDAIEPELPRS